MEQSENMIRKVAQIIEKEEDITSERVIQILKSDTGIDLVSRLGIILPDDRALTQDGTLSEPVNGITFKALDGKRTFITNMEPDNLKVDKFVLFFNIPLRKEGQTEGILFGVIEPQVLSDYFKVDIFDGNVASVIKVAELRMYEDKKRYYMSQGDRRKMR